MPLDQSANRATNNNFELYEIKNNLAVLNPYNVSPGLPLSIWQDKYSRRVCPHCRETLHIERRDGISKYLCLEHGETNEKVFQTWEERLREVVLGNFLLSPNPDLEEFKETLDLSVRGLIPFSGRHLQHGDADQPHKVLELHSNCSTSPFSFLTFLKLLAGSGVSSDYSTRVRVVNWDLMPNIRLVLDGGSDDQGDISKGAHADFAQAGYEFKGGFDSLREAQHKYPSDSEWVHWFTVKDSREGWAEIVSALETAAYHEKHRDKLFIFDFSQIRPAGSPIKGHQGRPASGPILLMRALLKVASIKGAYMPPWKQALFIDDYLSSCVSIGGIRRSAKMAVKWWEDKDIFDFIEIKRGGHLRMSNNSILVNKKFWQEAKDPRTVAYRVFHAACGAAYFDNTGEPGFVNVDNMRQNRQGMDKITIENYIDMKACGMELHPRTYDLVQKVLDRVKSGPYLTISNPCFASDTLIVTDKGAFPIKELVGKRATIWNGITWQEINTFRQTGENQPMIKIELQDGSELRVTYYHKMKLQDNSECEAKDLRIGDKLQLADIVYEGNLSLAGAYVKGFLLGDGHVENGNPHLNLYEPKYCCENRLIESAMGVPVGDSNTNVNEELGFYYQSYNNRKVIQGLTQRQDDLISWASAYKNGLPSIIYQLDNESKYEFIAGYFDADGTVADSKNGFSYQLTSISRRVLQDMQILLKSIGVRSKLGKGKPAGMREMPGGEYYCQDSWRLTISQYYSIILSQQVRFTRLESLARRTTTYQMKPRAGKVVAISDDGIDDAVYCCTVPDSHTIGLGIGIITGQCGEACLPSYGDDCLVGDISLHLAKDIKEAQRSAYLLGKALVRAKSFMPGIYRGEGERSNRIGISAIGIHEFIWQHYQLDFFDMISVYDHVFNDSTASLSNAQAKAMQAWQNLADIAYHGEKGAIEESRKFNLALPDTVTMLKPGGTVAKVMSATESANLPARQFYLRYIQYPETNPAVEYYRGRGYPILDISHKYSGYVAIGFPTEQPYVKMLKEAGHPDELIAVANRVSMTDNYKWLRLLEKFWLEYGEPANGMPRNAQIAFTMKYNPDEVSFDQFLQTILQHQPTIRCCTYNVCSSDGKVMEQTKELIDNYGYVPEYPISWEEYQEIVSRIEKAERELYNDGLNGCEGGVCSIDANIN